MLAAVADREVSSRLIARAVHHRVDRCISLRMCGELQVVREPARDLIELLGSMNRTPR
jgi:hypothetical protein